jgi:hypothetical protein
VDKNPHHFFDLFQREFSGKGRWQDHLPTTFVTVLAMDSIESCLVAAYTVGNCTFHHNKSVFDELEKWC